MRKTIGAVLIVTVLFCYLPLAEARGKAQNQQLQINPTPACPAVPSPPDISAALSAIAQIMGIVPTPTGRKITLNFALGNWQINPDKLLQHFSPEHYLCNIML